MGGSTYGVVRALLVAIWDDNSSSRRVAERPMNRPTRPSRTYSIPSATQSNDRHQLQRTERLLHTAPLLQPIVCSSNDIDVVVEENISKNQLYVVTLKEAAAL